MIKKYTFCIIFLLMSACCFSQAKDYSAYLKTITIAGKPVAILRVPDNDPSDPLQPYIFRAQWRLGDAGDYLTKGDDMDGSMIREVENSCRSILQIDSTFPVHYYQEESAAWQAVQNDKRKLERDIWNAKVQRQKDSLYLLDLKKGYAWVNTDTVWVRTKPDLKSSKTGSIFRLSYVKAYVVDDKEDWVEIEFAEHSGYILKEDLALDWEDMHLTAKELAKLKQGRYFSFTPTATYQTALAKEAAAEERSMKAANRASRREYIRGPRGGCYYLSANGNKVYVDRSLCN